MEEHGKACPYDLELAWSRLKTDHKGRCFINHPFLIQMIEMDLSTWLSHMAERLSKGYSPSPAVVCYEPKPRWLLRPGCTLRIDDELVYMATVGGLLPLIEAALRWSQGDPDTSYVLNRDPNQVAWVRAGFPAWNSFRKKSLAAARRSEFVVSIDIAAFYENIDIGRLISDVKGVGARGEVVDLLSACLNRWAGPRGKGIPQGYTPSDILAKLYLNTVDEAITHEGLPHLRYVDDIRIFCSSLGDAKRGLHLAIDRLRLRGLNVQSAKTEIMPAEEALLEIDGVATTIGTIATALANDLRNLITGTGYTMSLEEFQRIVSESAVAPPLDVLSRAFTSHFVDSSDDEFDSSLFHYILTRLGLAKSREAVRFCLELLPKRPEETRFILKYFADIGPDPSTLDFLVRYLQSLDGSNDFQVYQILRFFYEADRTCSGLNDVVRVLVRDRNRPHWLRSYAYALVGRYGTDADLEFLESAYSNAANDVEKADIICGLRRYEPTRRNSFLARVRRDGILEERAVKFVKQSDIQAGI